MVHLLKQKACEKETLNSSSSFHKYLQVCPLPPTKPNMCSRLFNCFRRRRSSRVNPFLYDIEDVSILGIDDIDTPELRKRMMANYSTQVLPEYPTSNENHFEDQRHYIEVVEPPVVEGVGAEPVAADPVTAITVNPNQQASPLEDVVYYSQWIYFWAVFLSGSVIVSMHPTPLKDSFPALFAVVRPGEKEMMATLQLVQLMCNPRDEMMNLNNVQEWMALINPTFDWNEHVARPLQYKQLLLQDTHLPEDVQTMIWNHHVQPDVVHQAIRRCAQDVVFVMDDELSQHAVTSLS